MPPTKLKMNHETARSRVRCICWRKTSRKLYSKQVPAVAEVYMCKFKENYSITSSQFPCGICCGCSFRIHSSKQLLLFNDISCTVRQNTRSLQVCRCRICQISRTNGLAAKIMKKKPGRPAGMKNICS